MTKTFSLVPADLITAFETDTIARYLDRAARILPTLARMVSQELVKTRENRLVEKSVAVEVRAATACGWFDIALNAPVSMRDLHQHYVACALHGGMVLSEAKVIESAKRTVAEAVAFFNVRVGEKIALVPNAPLHAIRVALRLNQGVIEGTVAIDIHTWNVSLKTNYRYGENAKNGDMTVYYQVPCLYAGPELGARVIAAAERALEAKTFGLRAELRAKKAALAERQDWLGRLRDAHERVEHRRVDWDTAIAKGLPIANPTFVTDAEAELARIIAKATTKGVTDPGSFAACKLARKAIKVEIDAVRAEELEEQRARREAKRAVEA